MAMAIEDVPVFQYQLRLCRLEYHGSLPKRFKNRVTVPEIVTDDERAIDAQDIRMLLLKCSNRRLKAYLLVLASGGMRVVEVLAIRIRDIDFTVRPTKIHIRAGYSKTRRERDIYISNEATQTLRERINWKYKNGKTQTPDDLVFQDYAHEKNKEPDPRSLYYDIVEEFSKLLELAGFVERKDSRSKRPRHKLLCTVLGYL
jgi:integrase